MTLRRWYKAHDLPEIRAENSGIIAVVESPEQLLDLIEEHNELFEAYAEVAKDCCHWRSTALSLEQRLIENL